MSSNCKIDVHAAQFRHRKECRIGTSNRHSQPNKSTKTSPRHRIHHKNTHSAQTNDTERNGRRRTNGDSSLCGVAYTTKLTFRTAHSGQTQTPMHRSVIKTRQQHHKIDIVTSRYVYSQCRDPSVSLNLLHLHVLHRDREATPRTPRILPKSESRRGD